MNKNKWGKKKQNSDSSLYQGKTFTIGPYDFTPSHLPNFSSGSPLSHYTHLYWSFDLFKICQTCSHLDIFTFASFCLEWPLPRYLHVSLPNPSQESAQISLLSYVFPDHPFKPSAILLLMCPTFPHITQTALYLLYLLTTHTWMETPWGPVFLFCLPNF